MRHAPLRFLSFFFFLFLLLVQYGLVPPHLAEKMDRSAARVTQVFQSATASLPSNGGGGGDGGGGAVLGNRATVNLSELAECDDYVLSAADRDNYGTLPRGLQKQLRAGSGAAAGAPHDAAQQL